MTWHDEFDGLDYDRAKWTFMYPGPSREAVNTPEAISVADGALSIHIFSDQGTSYSALLSTLGNFETTYGYFESRIRFHNTTGNWCAFWIQSPTIGTPMGNTAVAGTEIDVIEHRYWDYFDDLTNHMTMNLNWDGYGAGRQNIYKHAVPPDGAPSLQDNWHTYGVLWTSAGYTFYLDDRQVWTTTTAISQRPEHLWLSCEVQGASWAGGVPPEGYGSRATSVTRMDVDWVRAWQPK